MAAAASEFAASRKLLQRKSSRGSGGSSRGSGGLSLALSGSLSPGGGSPQQQDLQGRTGGISPASSAGAPAVSAGGGDGGRISPGGNGGAGGGHTALSSVSDFAAAAAHLESANSMRRSTSLGLAKWVGSMLRC
jgi:hypothetical protein